MDSIESKLDKLLQGKHINDSSELCDFTLAEQNEVAASKGVTTFTPTNYVPKIKETVTYIVMGVLFNQEGEVLLMQEAKRSCAGTWYLPAGRMEPGENIEEAVVREVLEETGLTMKPTTLLMIECASQAWFRFVLTGKVIGGELKTPAQADSESLQAKWVKNIKELSLRSSDIHSIIDFCRTSLNLNEPRHSDLLPSLRTHSKLLLRLVICIKQKSTNRVHILLSEKSEVHFPLCEINHQQNMHSTIRKFLVNIFGASVANYKVHGAINVEHCAKSDTLLKDGLCITLLISFRIPLEELFPIDKYTWLMVKKEQGDLILSKLPRNMAIHLNIIR